MGYLLNPNTGKEVTWYEVLAAMASSSYVTFKLACEEYTRRVIGTSKIDQTPPFKFGRMAILLTIFGILSLFYLVFKLKKTKK